LNLKTALLIALLFPFAPKLSLPPMDERKAEVGRADFIRVDKSERTLELLRSNHVIASYSIALGRSPVGDKEREGDMRTPEGRYVIDWRNPNSGYHLSLHISYPDKDDRAAAQAAGVSPGGDVMIHGQPNGYALTASLLLQQADWTYGCIAVTNSDMDEIWKAVPDGTPIEIAP
jgi:murein L,D-transpeptidase YafK